MKRQILLIFFLLLFSVTLAHGTCVPTHVVVPRCVAFVNAEEFEKFIQLYLISEKDGNDYFMSLYETDRAAIVTVKIPVCITGKKLIAERFFAYRVVSPDATGAIWVPKANLKRITRDE